MSPLTRERKNKEYRLRDEARIELGRKLSELGMIHFREEQELMADEKRYIHRIKSLNFFVWNITEGDKQYVLFTNPVVSQGHLYITYFESPPVHTALEMMSLFGPNKEIKRLVSKFNVRDEKAHIKLLKQVSHILPEKKFKNFQSKIKKYI